MTVFALLFLVVDLTLLSIKIMIHLTVWSIRIFIAVLPYLIAGAVAAVALLVAAAVGLAKLTAWAVDAIGLAIDERRARQATLGTRPTPEEPLTTSSD